MHPLAVLLIFKEKVHRNSGIKLSEYSKIIMRLKMNKKLTRMESKG
jgi:hypothetical protein